VADQFVAEHLSRWKFVLVTVAVWLPAGAAGAGLYTWWHRVPETTLPTFAVLVFLLACIVGGLLTALVQSRPAVSALALAIMSAPVASTVGAALVGGY
jgi:hypothetical protein